MTHPILSADTPRLDILYSRHSASHLEQEGLALAREGVRRLGNTGAVLYLNTLTSQEEVEASTRDLKRVRGGEAFYAETFHFGQLVRKLSVLTHFIEDRGVRLVVLNCFEFAYVSQHHKKVLIQWLKGLRDAMGCRVMVLMTRMPAVSGQESILHLLAQTVVDAETPEEMAMMAALAPSALTPAATESAAVEEEEHVFVDEEELASAVHQQEAYESLPAGFRRRAALRNKELAPLDLTMRVAEQAVSVMGLN